MNSTIYPRAMRVALKQRFGTVTDPWVTAGGDFAARCSQLQWISTGSMNGSARALQLRAQLVGRPGMRPVRTWSLDPPGAMPVAVTTLLQDALLVALQSPEKDVKSFRVARAPDLSFEQDEVLGGWRLDVDQLVDELRRSLLLNA